MKVGYEGSAEGDEGSAAGDDDQDSSDDSGSSVASFMEFDPTAMSWAIPQGGLMHLLQGNDTLQPLCSTRLLLESRCVRGDGLASAATQGGSLCPRCLQKLPLRTTRKALEALQ